MHIPSLARASELQIQHARNQISQHILLQEIAISNIIKYLSRISGSQNLEGVTGSLAKPAVCDLGL